MTPLGQTDCLVYLYGCGRGVISSTRSRVFAICASVNVFLFIIFLVRKKRKRWCCLHKLNHLSAAIDSVDLSLMANKHSVHASGSYTRRKKNCIILPVVMTVCCVLGRNHRNIISAFNIRKIIFPFLFPRDNLLLIFSAFAFSILNDFVIYYSNSLYPPPPPLLE